MKKFFWLILMASLGGATSWAMNNVNVATITLGTPACLAGSAGSITISAQGGVPPYMINLDNSDFSYNKTLPTPNTPPYTVTFTDLPLVTNTDDGEGYYTYTITDSAMPANTNTNEVKIMFTSILRTTLSRCLRCCLLVVLADHPPLLL